MADKKEMAAKIKFSCWFILLNKVNRTMAVKRKFSFQFGMDQNQKDQKQKDPNPKYQQQRNHRRLLYAPQSEQQASLPRSPQREQQ